MADPSTTSGHAVDPSGIQTPEDWVDGLRGLQDRAGLSVRDLVARMLTALQVSATDRERWLEALDRVRRLTERDTGPTEPPYRGLAGFAVGDAAWFFGREEATRRLVELAGRLPDRIVIVVGASGSGKSSLLAAGLAATLAERGWRYRLLTPTSDPLSRLDEALAELTGAEPADRASRLLVVDQLEELWTQGADPDAVRESLRRMHEAAARTDMVVVVGLRADFYSRALADPDLAASAQDCQVVLGPMAADDLVRAITQPAQQAQLQVEDGLVELLLHDLAPSGPVDGPGTGAAHDPGALPLLGFALLQTWRLRTRSALTIDDYRRAGGISGAVAEAAEAAFTAEADADADAEAEAIARRIFRRLVSVGEDTADTRRRARRTELDGLGENAAAVVERFVAARLLTADRDRVEITHEAMLVAWPRLRSWLGEDRAGLLHQHRLIAAARQWQESGRDPDLLLRGGQLETAHDLLADPDRAAALTETERGFVAEAGRAERARTLERRRHTRRLQTVAGSLAVALVLVGALAVFSRHLQNTAQDERDLALSRQLAEAAERLRDTDPTVAAQFALLGYRTAPTVEARSALLDTSANPLSRRLTGPGGPAVAAVSSDGRLLAAAGDQGGVRLWRLTGSQQVPEPAGDVITAQDGPLYAVAVAPDAHLVAAAGGRTGVVHLWDTTDPAAPLTLPGLDIGDLAVLALAFSPDGHTLVAAGLGKKRPNLMAWHVTGTATEPFALQLPEEATPGQVPATLQALAFSADGAVLAAGGEGGLVHRWSLTGPNPTLLTPSLTGPDGPTGTMTALAFAPDGRQLAASSKDQNVYRWPLRGPAATDVTAAPSDLTLGGAGGWVNTVAYSPDGSQLVAGGSDAHLRWYETATGARFAEARGPGPVTAAAYTSDGAALFTANSDGNLRQWPLPLPSVPMAGGRTWSAEFFDDDRLLAASSKNVARAVESGPSTLQAIGPVTHAPDSHAPDDGFAGTLALGRHGDLVLATGRDGASWLYRRSPSGGLSYVAELPHLQMNLIQAGALTGPNDEVALTADDDSTLEVSDVSNPADPRAVGRPMTTDGIVYGMAAAHHTPLLATGTGAMGAVQLWDITDPRHPTVISRAPVEGGPSLQVFGLSFSPDDTTLAVGSADTLLRFLDVSDPHNPRWVGPPVAGAGGYLFAVRYSDDGRRLATVSGDGVVRIYDLDGAAHPTIDANLSAMSDGGVYAVAFDPAGVRVVAGGSAERLDTWSIDPEEAAARVCTWLGDPITEQEWNRYVPSVPRSSPCAKDD